MSATVARWEAAGTVVIFVAGCILHFAYEWLGRSPFVGLFAAVNESVWEHLKLAFWPAMGYALLEWLFLRKSPGFFAAKAAGICLMPVLIVVLHYGYRLVLPHHVVWLDILIFLVAVAGGQFASYLLLTAGLTMRRGNIAGLAVLALLAVLFGVFTLRPPRLPIFRDSTTGGYGTENAPLGQPER
ncbi:MAG: DUF6512 family protein [Candidatus Brocadiaceae bacterium]|jgi:hypothetical protein